MASPLIESLMNLAGPMLGPVANQLGESPQAVSTGMKTGVSAILAGLAGQAGDTGTMNQVAQAASAVDADTMLADPRTLLSLGSGSTSQFGGLLSTLFGARAGAITDLIARTSGMKGSSATSLLSMAVPLVLAFLKKQSGGSLSASSLSSMLLGQRDAIMEDAPTGLASLLGVGGAAGAAGTARTTADVRDTTRVVPPHEPSSGRNWLWPVLGVLALLALLWFAFGRDRTGDVDTVDADTMNVGGMMDSAAAGVSGAAGAAGAAVSGAAANLGAFVSRSLPGGVELNVPENGVESRLLSFIADGNRAVSDTVWFNFDRLLFETGSARLTNESNEQVDNIAAILKAYPNVNIKLGGYTDNTGDAAANVKLSGDRAKAVMAALVSRGIPAERLEAEGYGDEHPVADNATPEGRDQNRRIAIRVTKK